MTIDTPSLLEERRPPPPPVPPAVDESAADATTALPPGGPWSPPYRLLTTGLVLTIGGAAFEALAVATILPATVGELGGLAFYGWVFSAFMLANLIGTAIAGGEADVRGPARPFAVGVGLFVAGLVIGGTAPSMTALIVGRAVQGLGGGVIGSVAFVAVGRGYPAAAKPRMLALMSTAWVVPGLIGPAIAGLMADHLGWRWVFLGLGPLMVVAAVLALPPLRRIPGGRTPNRDWWRIVRAVQLAAGCGVLLAGLSAQRFVALPLILAGGALGWPALQRLLPAGTMRAVPGLPAAVATMGLLNLGFFGADAFVPLALTSVRGRSASFAGLALTAATIAWSTGSWLLARSTRRSRREVVRTGLGLVAAGIAGAALVLSPAVPSELAIAAWGIAGLGIGLAYSTMSLVVLETAPVGQEGVSIAGMQLANALGVALGAGIGGALIAAFRQSEEVSTTSLVSQNLLMIGVIGLAFAIAGRLPVRPTRD
jgi:MFS family permease